MESNSLCNSLLKWVSHTVCLLNFISLTSKVNFGECFKYVLGLFTIASQWCREGTEPHKIIILRYMIHFRVPQATVSPKFAICV